METTQDALNTSPFLSMTIQSIESWIQAKEGRSIRAIEYHSGVSRNYITRLVNGEIAEAKLDVFKVYSILKVILGEKEATAKILNCQSLRDRFIQVMGLPENTIGMIKMSHELDQLVREREVGLTLILAANHVGTTISQVLSVCGEKGAHALEKLAELGYISIEGDKVTLTEEYQSEKISFTRDTYKFLIPHLIGEYSPKRAGKNWNYIAAITESFNRDFQQKIQQKMDEFRKWITVESLKEENKGEIPLFVTMAMDSLCVPPNSLSEVQ